MNALLIAYIIVNVISFAVYGYDKLRAVRLEWRVPEKTLLALGLIGPWGAVLGMLVFRHKIRKPKFALNYLFLIIHIILIAWLIAGE